MPGAVQTTILCDGLNHEHLQGEGVTKLLQQLGSRYLMGQICQSGEIAEAIYLLADGWWAFTTPQNLVVDDRATARLSKE